MRKKRKRHLHKKGQKWTPREENLLREMYPGMFNHELEEYFDRSASSILGKAFRMGLRKDWIKDSSRSFQSKPWSKKELEQLKELFPATPIAKLLKHFPKRTKGAIRAQAGSLGLQKNYTKQNRLNQSNKNFWREQKDLLIKLYPTTSNEELAKIFGRSPDAIRGKARSMGLHKLSYNPDAQNKSGTWDRWSDKEIKKLRQLWEEGYTDSQIAEMMDTPLGRIRCQLHKQKQHGVLKKKRKSWTKKEDEYLTRYYYKKPFKELAAKLGRKVRVIQGRAFVLGITQSTQWSRSDIRKLRRLWQQGHTVAQIAEILGKTKSSVSHQMERERRDSGLPKKCKPWLEKEDEYLTRHYYQKPLDQIAATLGRTKNAIKTRARALQITKSKSWAASEINILKKYYGQQTATEIAKKLSRTRFAVQIKSSKLGLGKIQ